MSFNLCPLALRAQVICPKIPLVPRTYSGKYLGIFQGHVRDISYDLKCVLRFLKVRKGHCQSRTTEKNIINTFYDNKIEQMIYKSLHIY